MLHLLPFLALLAADAPIAGAKSEDELKFGIDVARKGLWNEARFRFEKAVTQDPNSAGALNNLAVALEQQGAFDQAREAYEKALKLQPGSLYIRRTTISSGKPMTSGIASQEEADACASSRDSSSCLRRRRSCPEPARAMSRCRSRRRCSRRSTSASFRRVLVAGFVTELGDERRRRLRRRPRASCRTSSRSNTKLQVLEPDRPPLHDALEKALEKLGEGGKYTKEEKDQYRWRRTASCRTPSSGGRSARSSRTP
jgi:tetratricopeptide (TPR) repeat protein